MSNIAMPATRKQIEKLPYDILQAALWIDALVAEHGGNGALGAWDTILTKLVESYIASAAIAVSVPGKAGGESNG